MLKLYLLLLIGVLSFQYGSVNSGDTNWKSFYKSFYQCDTITFNKSFDFEIGYIELQKKDNKIDLVDFKGKQGSLIENRVKSILNCINTSKFENFDYNIIYVYHALDSKNVTNKNIEVKVNDFKDSFNIQKKTKLYRIIYSHTVN